jgi:hypothetical protein
LFQAGDFGLASPFARRGLVISPIERNPTGRVREPMKFCRIRTVFSLEAWAVLAVMTAVVASLAMTARQIWRTQVAAPGIARAFREQPERAMAELLHGPQLPLEAEIQCVACTNRPATNETPRI